MPEARNSMKTGIPGGTPWPGQVPSGFWLRVEPAPLIVRSISVPTGLKILTAVPAVAVATAFRMPSRSAMTPRKPPPAVVQSMKYPEDAGGSGTAAAENLEHGRAVSGRSKPSDGTSILGRIGPAVEMALAVTDVLVTGVAGPDEVAGGDADPHPLATRTRAATTAIAGSHLMPTLPPRIVPIVRSLSASSDKLNPCYRHC